jgi:hypothetical protein
MSSKLQSVRTLDDVRKLLGEPDVIRHLPPILDAPPEKLAKTAWFYERHTDTFEVLIQELMNGAVIISYPMKKKYA